jgi:hypothetical protein
VAELPKVPVRAEMVTGTVMFMHDFAATEPASTLVAIAVVKCMLSIRSEMAEIMTKLACGIEGTRALYMVLKTKAMLMMLRHHLPRYLSPLSLSKFMMMSS